MTIKCIKEFTSNQTIELKAFKTEDGKTIEAIVGKLNVWANDNTKTKKKDVVFVEIKTPELSTGSGKRINLMLMMRKIGLINILGKHIFSYPISQILLN